MAATVSMAAPAATANAVPASSHVNSMLQSIHYPRSIPAPIEPSMAVPPTQRTQRRQDHSVISISVHGETACFQAAGQ